MEVDGPSQKVSFSSVPVSVLAKGPLETRIHRALVAVLTPVEDSLRNCTSHRQAGTIAPRTLQGPLVEPGDPGVELIQRRSVIYPRKTMNNRNAHITHLHTSSSSSINIYTYTHPSQSAWQLQLQFTAGLLPGMKDELAGAHGPWEPREYPVRWRCHLAIYAAWCVCVCVYVYNIFYGDHLASCAAAACALM